VFVDPEGIPENVLEMVVLEDHIEGVVVLDVLVPECVHTFICVEIKTNTGTVVLGMYRGRWWTRPDFFIFIVEGGAGGPFFCFPFQFFTFCLTYYQPYESMTG